MMKCQKKVFQKEPEHTVQDDENTKAEAQSMTVDRGAEPEPSSAATRTEMPLEDQRLVNTAQIAVAAVAATATIVVADMAVGVVAGQSTPIRSASSTLSVGLGLERD